MKDLYQRTGISPTASAEVIRQLFASQSDSEDRAATRQILQVEHRRRVYDRVRETYVTLGAVAANIRMSGEIPEDFRRPPSAFAAQIPRYLKRYRRKFSQRNRCVWAVLLLLILGAFGIIVLASKHTISSPTPPRSQPLPPTPEFPTPRHFRRLFPTPEFPTPPPFFPTPEFPTPPPSQPLPPTPPPFNQPPEPLPPNGLFWAFPGRSRIAPLKVTTQSGNRYYIKLVDAHSKAPIITIFVDGAQTIQVAVPLGTFELRWASGWLWYGLKDLFGPETTCTKGVELLSFTRAGDYVQGHDVTLYEVPDGNFRTAPIPKSEF